MQRAPHEVFFKRRPPFMERTVRDDLGAFVAGLVGFTAAFLLDGHEPASVFAFAAGTGLVLIAGQGIIRRAIRRRRNGESEFPPPD